MHSFARKLRNEVLLIDRTLNSAYWLRLRAVAEIQKQISSEPDTHVWLPYMYLKYHQLLFLCLSHCNMLVAGRCSTYSYCSTPPVMLVFCSPVTTLHRQGIIFFSLFFGYIAALKFCLRLVSPVTDEFSRHIGKGLA